MLPLASLGTVVTVALLAIMVAGYVVLWALWHFVFRARPEEREREAERR